MSGSMTTDVRGVLIACALTISSGAYASEVGHYSGGAMNIRDYLVPAAGTYAALYNYYYTTDQLNDAHGGKVDSTTIDPPGGGPGVTLGVDVNVDLVAFSPTLMWVTNVESLGIKYGAVVTQTVVNTSLDASLSTVTGRGGHTDSGTVGLGDLFVQPLWLGKTTEHWDFALSYGFYAPTGKYDTETVTLPLIGPVRVESSDNIGSGYWTQQLQTAVAWYPMAEQGTAVVAALTYETNGKKQHFDITPGDVVTLNWGVSQYLPLNEHFLLEVGPAAYDTWQVTHDSGSAANGNLDEVHAVGGQLGVSYLPWNASLNLVAYNEYAAKDRFEGASIALNFAMKI